MKPMTSKELTALKGLRYKWATGTATARDVRRCMDLEQKERLQAQS